MIFTLVTEDSSEFNKVNNPLIVEEVSVSGFNNIQQDKSRYFLFNSFVTAVNSNKKEVSYLTDIIEDNIFWSEDLDIFFYQFLKKIKEGKKINTIFTTKFLSNSNPMFLHEQDILYENEKIIVLYSKEFFIIDKTITGYFEIKEDKLEEIRRNTSYLSYEDIKYQLKFLGLVTKDFTLKNLEEYLKKLFKDEYYLYIPIVFRLFVSLNCSEVVVTSSKQACWKCMFEVQDYFNSVKIYGLKQNEKYDFNFQKDENNNYFVQYEYNCTETTTGRMFPINLKGYQALQTLPKEDRNLLNAEKDCILIEFDFKNFEIFILECETGMLNSISPHENICNLLGLNAISDREFGKKINYAIIYGNNLDSLTEIIFSYCNNKSKEEIKNILHDYYLISSRDNLTKAIITKNQYHLQRNKIFLKSGRLIKFEKYYAILNNYIQGCAADIFYERIQKILNLFQELKLGRKNKILIQNHDSFLLQLELKVIACSDILENIKAIVKKETRNSYFKDLNFTIKTGYNWGEMS